jgi:tRNA(Ile)-lysidine synthase
LKVADCAALKPARQRNLLRHWLRELQLPPASRAQLEQIQVQLNAAEDAQVLIAWPGAEVRRFQGKLYAMPSLAPPAEIDQSWMPGADFSMPGLGTLRAEPVTGSGLRADRSYHIRNRRGGERCRPVGRAHSQTLKKLLQDAAVPPWLRDRLPLIYCGDALAAVGDLWICEGFEAPEGAAGWRLSWQLDVM